MTPSPGSSWRRSSIGLPRGYDTEGQADLSGFTDLTQVSTYAREAMAWCVDAGLLSGTSPTTLSPRGQATRAQTAAVLMRLCQGYGM